MPWRASLASARTLPLLATLVAMSIPTAGPLARSAAAKPAPGKTVRVLLWSEQTEPRDVYPEGISGALAKYLNGQRGFTAKTAQLDDPEAGLSEAALAETDVLV